jgi:tRNA pseudouridine32 synthase/23S rRNA pseudouridine746 synthase
MSALPERSASGEAGALWRPLVPDTELPSRFPSPFDPLGPHPLARQAAAQLISALEGGEVALGGEGKMFGVLVCRRPDGSVGFLRAFSGMIRGEWTLPGFVGPLFDPEARVRVELPGERAVSALTARARTFEASPRFAEIEARIAELDRGHREALSELASRLKHNKAARAERRSSVDTALTEAARAEALHALDQESRKDKAERRTLLAALAREREEAERERLVLQRRRAAHARLRGAVSRRLMQAIHDTYVFRNARGEGAPLRSLFASGEPPSGAGDCAGPKLLGAAYRLGLTPLALAELWWGPPPASGGRRQGSFYPACPNKCGPLLPFMLQGLPVEPARRFLPPDVRHAPLEIVHEDRWLVVVNKPAGLLSVPGKDAVGDSALERLRERHPDATGPLLVHRLDLDTSGLLVACLDARAHGKLQKQFIGRTVEKRYVAVLEGRVGGEAGEISLPLRVDLNDRPRQIHDPTHGKPAVTRWELVAREEDTTRVHLFPKTGRTHQLRVHAAHPEGLGAPIVGDRLYGREGERLLLHAESLSFVHPGTGERVTFLAPAPF